MQIYACVFTYMCYMCMLYVCVYANPMFSLYRYWRNHINRKLNIMRIVHFSYAGVIMETREEILREGNISGKVLEKW